ncbi:MAG TPA: SDR family oxidoreductase [Solirubrobacterales bacterium]|jgi:3alpha(or 20beta)-hydroxysteroid dehydrogenase
MRVEGKIVIVTGAAQGQGAAFAEALRTEGATVIATDVNAGPGVDALDVSRQDAWNHVVARTVDEHGRIDGLVNNAGITYRARLGDVELEPFETLMRINVTGPLLGIQTVLPYMPDGGSIVNLGSVAAFQGHYPVAYTMSKWAIRGLTSVAAMELGGRRIRVNSIHPGYIETPMTASAVPEFREASLRQSPIPRAGTTDDTAPLVVFLIADESSYISGAEISVDGGTAAHAGGKVISDALRQVGR